MLFVSRFSSHPEIVKSLVAASSASVNAVNKKGEDLNAKLQSFNVLKAKLLSVVSHDVKSPLNSIQSIPQLLNTQSLSPDETVSMFRKIGEQNGEDYSM